MVDDLVRPKSKIIQEQFAFFCSRTYTTSKIIIDEIIFSNYKLQVKVAVVCFLTHGQCNTSGTPALPTSQPSPRRAPTCPQGALPVAASASVCIALHSLSNESMAFFILLCYYGDFEPFSPNTSHNASRPIKNEYICQDTPGTLHKIASEQIQQQQHQSRRSSFST